MQEQSYEKKTNFNYYFIISIVLVLIDQATKLYFKGFNFFGINHIGLDYGEQVPVIGTFLQWTYIENAGMAFGIEFGWGKIFLSLFSIVASIFLAYILLNIKTKNIPIKLGFTLIFAGAVGNLIDRVFYGVIFREAPLFYGRVVDFIQVDIPDIGFLNWQYFPIFNVADSCVTVGVILLIIFHNHLPDFNVIFSKHIKENNI
ncbi:MAG TPA: signal peptidase II [Candidatus Kapabacteria bacterium]|nr:signal peptidase II [Candidatus Kapabacteria bacterium]